MAKLKRKITRTDGNQKFEIWPSGKVRISKIDDEHEKITIEPTGEIKLERFGSATITDPEGQVSFQNITRDLIF